MDAEQYPASSPKRKAFTEENERSQPVHLPQMTTKSWTTLRLDTTMALRTTFHEGFVGTPDGVRWKRADVVEV